MDEVAELRWARRLLNCARVKPRARQVLSTGVLVSTSGKSRTTGSASGPPARVDRTQSASPASGTPASPTPDPPVDRSLTLSAAVAGPDGTTLLSVSRAHEPPADPARGDTTLVINAVGEVDLDTVGLLRTALLDAVGRHPHVCCDLSGVTFFGAAAVNALVTAHQEAVGHGHRLSLRGASGIVLEVLQLTGLDRTLGR